ncbi:MAG: 16S rRNA (cytosine(967)-C(5))-methyltransferase RsmB [Clostridia bacterium]|nr:16S rRNA (cytosine(967)-C(5))-methyltransferase RsmB [Clostridia bacterium]
MIDKAREIALKVLYKIEKEEAYSNIALDDAINNNRKNLNEKDIGLISQIVYGVTTWRLTLDAIIEKNSKIKLKKISPWILNILRMGIYQIIFLDKIPNHSAVDESVNLAKRYGNQGSKGFVNAVLRKITVKDYEDLFNIENKIEKISKTQSMPVWIIEELFKNNKIEDVEEICKNLNLKPDITIRVNNLKTNKQELKDILTKKNIVCEEISNVTNNNEAISKELDKQHQDFLIIKNAKNIENLEEFRNGLFTVQDTSAGLTAIMLDPKENETILDACSAPGGKTTYIAELMNNNGKICAWDIYPHRIKLIEDNCKRLGISIVKTKIQDASQPQNDLTKQQPTDNQESLQLFDKILLDVPCLGIGVIKRKPDIKWQRKPEDVQEIANLQYEILQNCAKFLKENGILVYSTCSILQEENENIIRKFLQENKKFKIEKEVKIVPSKEADGFYICKLLQ